MNSEEKRASAERKRREKKKRTLGRKRAIRLGEIE